MRAQVNVDIEVNAGGESLRAYVLALLEPIRASCDINIRVIHRQEPLLGVNTPPETETPDDQ